MAEKQIADFSIDYKISQITGPSGPVKTITDVRDDTDAG